MGQGAQPPRAPAIAPETRNPYAAPAAKLADPPPRPGSPVKAVLLGSAADLGCSFAGWFVLDVVYELGWLEGIARYSSMAFGLSCSVLGGWVCARTARRLEFRLGAIVALLSVLGGYGYSSLDPESLDAWDAFWALVGGACVMLGAYLGRVRNRREPR